MLDREAIAIFLIQDFEADFLWKFSLKILNSGIILKTFTHSQNFCQSKSIGSCELDESLLNHCVISSLS